LTAAITKVLQKHNPKIVFRSFDSIDQRSGREGAPAITIATAHVEYETANGTTRTSIAGPPDYIKK